jgi:hypothetical protein
MTIMDEMRPGWKHVAGWLETAGGLSASDIKKIRKDVLNATGRWNHFARQSDVPRMQTEAIESELAAIAAAVDGQP